MKAVGWLGAAVGGVVVILAWLTLAPRALGGTLQYVIVSGTSMEPALRSGDLVLLRASPSYRLGDVVGYESATLGRTVLHRIVWERDGRFVLKGDNNDWRDTDRPVAHEVVGRMWLRIPAVGRILQPLLGRGRGVALAGVLIVGALARRTRKGAQRNRTPRPDGTVTTERRTSRAALFGADIGTLRWVARGALLLFLTLAIVSFAHPSSKPTTRSVPLRHVGMFAYSASAPDGPVYDGSTVATGDPVFLQLVDEMTVSFEYRLDGPAVEAIEGVASLGIGVSDANGWTHSVQLRAPVAFRGDHVTVEGRLDLEALQRLTREVEQLTGVAPGSYLLSVGPEIVLGGELEGRSFEERFTPRLTFRMDPLHLWLADEVPDGAPRADLLSPTEATSVDLPGTAPSDLSVSGIALSVVIARVVATLGAILSLWALLWTTRRVRADERLEEPERIGLRYGDWLMNVTGAVELEDAIEVSTIEDLARLAEQFGLVILAGRQEGEHIYHLRHQGQTFFYRASTRVPGPAVLAKLPARSPVTAGAAAGQEDGHRQA
jgi:signal peptidase I